MGRIKLKQKEMYKKAERYGLTDRKTVSCSQELDLLLNKYQQIQAKAGGIWKMSKGY